MPKLGPAWHWSWPQDGDQSYQLISQRQKSGSFLPKASQGQVRKVHFVSSFCFCLLEKDCFHLSNGLLCSLSD